MHAEQTGVPFGPSEQRQSWHCMAMCNSTFVQARPQLCSQESLRGAQRALLTVRNFAFGTA